MIALVLDFGGPVLRTPFELLRGGEQRAGLSPGSLSWAGPFDPDTDPDWRLLQSGGISEREYWRRRTEEFASLTGCPAEFTALTGVLYDAPESDVVRPEADQLIRDAKDAGFVVAVLTNDLLAFHGAEWVAGLDVLRQVDLVVDGSVEGVLKPDAAAYQLVLDRLELEAIDLLFVDDQPANIRGAESLGIPSITFDVTDTAGTFRTVRELMGLS
jgi:putative hydrolase of the HAD superfamily